MIHFDNDEPTTVYYSGVVTLSLLVYFNIINSLFILSAQVCVSKEMDFCAGRVCFDVTCVRGSQALTQ